MNTFAFERFMNIGNILKSIIFAILILNLSLYFGEKLELDKIVSFLITSGFLFLILVFWLRLSSPIEVKEGQKAKDMLIDYQQVSGCEDVESLQYLIGNYEQKKELLLQSKEMLIQMQSMLVQNADAAEQTEKKLKEVQEKLEQTEKNALELQTNFQQSEESKKQLEDELATLQSNFVKLQEEKQQIFKAAEQTTADLELERAACKQADLLLEQEKNKVITLQNEKAGLVLELDKFKTAIQDLKNSDFGKLINEESTNGFSRGYHNKSIEKRILPQSIIDLF